MALLTAQNVALGYDGNIIAENLTFSVNSGDYLCIVGENGSGKSTLIKAILGLKPPISGSVCIGDGLKPNEIGYLPQQTEVQKDFPASVREVVLSGCLNRCGLRPFYNKEEKRLAEDNMKRLGIEDLSRHSYRELSGGQQQRVLLARALCATRSMLLLDEPVTGLDPMVSAGMYSLIHDLNHDDGLTVIMVSHDIRSAVKYASHILHLSREPLFFGTTEDYLKSGVGKIFLSGEEDTPNA
ncbi:MAG: ABC transporter ATP-binding protein [Clostridiaceae bacterium]|nr:ABC transporter ATP-binding protein [Clostridiaceae bacterium]